MVVVADVFVTVVSVVDDTVAEVDVCDVDVIVDIVVVVLCVVNVIVSVYLFGTFPFGLPDRSHGGPIGMPNEPHSRLTRSHSSQSVVPSSDIGG